MRSFAFLCLRTVKSAARPGREALAPFFSVCARCLARLSRLRKKGPQTGHSLNKSLPFSSSYRCLRTEAIFDSIPIDWFFVCKLGTGAQQVNSAATTWHTIRWNQKTQPMWKVPQAVAVAQSWATTRTLPLVTTHPAPDRCCITDRGGHQHNTDSMDATQVEGTSEKPPKDPQSLAPRTDMPNETGMAPARVLIVVPRSECRGLLGRLAIIPEVTNPYDCEYESFLPPLRNAARL